MLKTSTNPPAVHFSYNLTLRRMGDGALEVGGNGNWFQLSDSREYWRLVALLEKPLSEVVNAFEQAGIEIAFVEIVRFGLKVSTNWAGCAVGWIPQLSNSDQRSLLPELAILENGPRSEQKLRHIARALRNKIARDD